MKRQIFTLLKLSLFLAIGLLFIWLFVRKLSQQQIDDILFSIKNAEYFWLFLSIAIGLLSHVSRAMRWMLLLTPMNYKPRFKNVFLAVMIGYFANLAFPRLGEVMRCGILKRYENIPVGNSFGTVIAERALDLLLFIVLFFVNILIQYRQIKDYIYHKVYIPLFGNVNIESSFSFYLLIGVLLFLVLLFFILRRFFRTTKFYKGFIKLINGFWQGLKSISKLKKPGLFIFHSIFIWFLYYLMFHICVYSLPETSDLKLEASFSALIFGSIGIMIVQGGIGIYPAIIAEVLTIYDVLNIKGYALGWLVWMAQTVMIIIAGLVALVVLPVINKNKNEKPGNHTIENSKHS